MKLVYPTKVVKLFSNNFFQELLFNVMDASCPGGRKGQGLLQGVEKVLSHMFIPALRKAFKGWGDLDNKESKKIREDFLNMLDSFVTILVSECFSYAIMFLPKLL